MTEQPSTTGFLDVPGASLYYECAGQGHPLLLIHAGIADSRMWDEQFSLYVQHYRVIRYDLRGYGQTRLEPGTFANHEDVTALLDALDARKAHIIGVSFGSAIALDFTLTHPDMVTSLVMVAPTVSGDEPSERIRQFIHDENALMEQDDIAGATELNLRLWVDGIHRSPEQVNPTVRQRVYDMQYHAFTIPMPEGIDHVKALQEAISGIIDIQAGRNLSEYNQGYAYGFVMRFIDSEHLKAYAPHPAHQLVSEELQHICQKIVDFDIA